MSKLDYPEEVEQRHMNILDAVAGIDIDRLREIAAAERDGRVVVLPCKVGDTVCAIVRCGDIQMHHDNEYLTGTGAVECPFEGSCIYYECDDNQNQVLETTVTNWWLQGDEEHEEPEMFLDYVQKSYYLRDIGKTIFLTRAEAEAALAGKGESRGK